MISKLDHIGIVVENLDECLKKYEKMFQIKAKHIEKSEDRNVLIAFLPVGEAMLELVQPITAGKGQASQFLKERGEGFSHIAYRVDDLEGVVAEMKQAGIKLRDEAPRVGVGGSRIAFISPEETNNVLVELVERGGGDL